MTPSMAALATTRYMAIRVMTCSSAAMATTFCKSSMGSDLDTISYAGATSGVTVNLSITGVGQNTFGAGTDTLDGDFHGLIGSSQGDTLIGGFLDNVIDGGGGSDSIEGGQGNDTLQGGAGQDTLLGGDDADVLEGGLGNDSLDGGAGGGLDRDTASYASALLAVTADLNFGEATGADIGDDTLIEIENLTGGAGDDTLTGDIEANVLNGGGGADTLFGDAGNDRLIGGGGDDVIDGGDEVPVGTTWGDVVDYSATTLGVVVNLATLSNQATGVEIGTDQIVNVEEVIGGSGADTLTSGSSSALTRRVLYGGDGNDVLKSSVGNDNFYGDAGFDTVDYSMTTSGVTLDLQQFGTSGGATGTEIGADSLYDVEIVLGGSGNDTMTGQFAGQTFIGNGGNDTFFMYSGGSNGSNTFDGGADVDTAVLVASGNLNFTLDASGNASFANGSATTNLLGIENVTVISSISTNDTITGNGAGNIINGGLGNDSLSGGGGDDTVNGGQDNDSIDGGAGNDTMDGSTGTADTVSFASTTLGVVVNLAAATNQAVGAESGTDQLANFERVTGGSGADNITGNTTTNRLDGADGNDTLDGGLGNDTLIGGAGADQFRYAAFGFGTDTLSGFVTTVVNGAEHDRINLTGLGQTFGSLTITYGANAVITFAGQPGNQITLTGVTSGLQASDFIFAPELVTFTGTAGDDVANASNGTLTGFTGGTVGELQDAIGDFFNAGDGADRITAGAGNDTVNGEGGNDLIFGSLGNDTYDGGAGTGDTVDYSAATNAVTVTLDGSGGGSASGADVGSDTLTAIENVTGGAGADTFNLANAVQRTLNGAGGSDSADYTASSGAVILDVGAGAAPIAGHDRLINIEVITGSGLDDTFNVNDAADQTLNAGNGNDTLSYANIGTAITCTLNATGTNAATGTGVGTDTFSNFETINGGFGSDVFSASDSIQRTLNGSGGNDSASYAASGSPVILDVGAGAAPITGHDRLINIESVTGSALADTFNVAGLANSTTIDGGAGTDTLSYAASTSGVALNLGAGPNNFDGSGRAINFESIVGTSLNDRFAMTESGANAVDAGAGMGDTAIYAGQWRDYSITGTPGALVVFNPSVGSDTLNNFEFLTFANGTFTASEVLNDAPTDITFSTTALAAGAPDGSEVGVLGWSDPDAPLGDTATYSLVNSASGRFGISGNTIVVADTGAIVAGNAYSITVRITDARGATFDEAFVINAGSASAFTAGNDSVTLATPGTTSHALAGNDFVQGTTGADIIFGNDGFDSVYGGAGGDGIYGGANEDVLVGDAGNDTIYGGDGGDILSELFDVAGSGNDLIDGGNNVDIIYAAAGDDTVYGGSDLANNYGNLGDGADTYTGSAGTDVVEAGSGADTVFGGDGDDSLYGDADNDSISGGSGIDLLSGSTGNDTLDGGADNDLLVGDSGNDVLRGGAGIDILFGFADDDTLKGGADTDALYGGAGNDQFLVAGTGYGYDYIYDFTGAAGASDQLMFSSSAFADVAAVRAASQFYGGNSFITANNGSITVLVGVNLTSVLDEDILVSNLF